MARIRSALVENLYFCAECGSNNTAVHHVFYGTANRRLAQEDGYIIGLCPRHHNMSDEGIHFNPQLDIKWKRYAQHHFERTHSREEFIARYGKSWL